MKRSTRTFACAAAIAGAVVLGSGTAQADPAGQWSEDGLTYCDPYCDNFDKTAPRFSADPSSYVCTGEPNPDALLCGVVMDVVRILPPFSAGPVYRALAFAS